RLVIEIEASANEIIKSEIAANHVENLATQTEATTATDNTKTMTPLRTKQLLDSKLLNMVYPIGSIYMSVNSATPATLFGGTWERFSKGRVLVGVDESDTVLATSGKQGGSTNPLTAHTHTTQLTTYRVTSTGSGAVNNLARSTDQGNAMTGEFGSVTSTGDNTDHKNWQPFTTVYIWKRTA
ncbi:phage baseplate protein, partial [Enterococcus avium]|uniref:phage baseplate protein n=1 Tax=Enterococcus avium TaxID=33945 RepID=UPI0032E84404